MKQVKAAEAVIKLEFQLLDKFQVDFQQLHFRDLPEWT